MSETNHDNRPVLTGAEILVRALALEGVTHVFGYPGGAILPVYDEIYKQTAFEHILVRHEQAAVHAADAYSRTTDKVGVAIVTSGPGATNAVTGIATAYMDSIPMVVLSGQVGTKLIGSDAFQECDTVGITRPCVKHNFLVKNVADLAETIKKAFYVASTGRPGPVLIDLPKDVQTAQAPFSYPDQVVMPSYRPTIKGHPGQIKKALGALCHSRHPLLYVGGGVVLARAHDKLNRFANRLGIPVVYTLMGIGGFDGNDKLSLGMVGMHGTLEANMAMHHADTILCIGARFDDRVIGNTRDFEAVPRKIIHVDIDPSSIAKNVHTDIPVVGDVNDVLEQFLALLDENNEHIEADTLADWWTQINAWRAQKSLDYDRTSLAIKPQAVIERVAHVAPDNTVYTTDVGEHQMFAAQYLKINEPKRFCSSGGLGTMGYGLPAAMGACVANPDKPCVCFTGDGSIQMLIEELAVFQQYALPAKVFIINNGHLGMVAQWQRKFFGGRLSQSVMDVQPDFVKLAQAYGHIGLRATTYEELDEVINDTFGKYADRFVLVDVHVDPEELVMPMVGPGQGLTQMLLR